MSMSVPDPNELRLAANGRFAANSLDEALPLYSLAVEAARTRIDQQQHQGQEQEQEGQDPDLVIHLCNRSACLYKMEMYGEARIDAAEAATLAVHSPQKALFRLARAEIALKDYSSSICTIKKAMSFCEHQLKKEHQLHTDSADKSNPLLRQKKEFEKLHSIALRKQEQSANDPNPSPHDIKSIKLEPRTPSIKEFTRSTKSSDDYKPLGEGNFSTVVICQHNTTKESFALKIIEKEECKKLAKRQHPNVYNEVAMERRILTENRLPHHVNIIQSYHAMQDYGNLYFLMELHQEHGDLWSKIRYQSCMVGCHSSLIRTYAYEILAALEHCHSHGIVHRDLKPENILLSERMGHIILIDFGTAKDLISMDLNGPEFVGTPDFMSPEAVKELDLGGNGCDFSADLWALGVVLYQMYAGALPFESQSPYLGFLKIQRAVFSRNLGVWDDDAWDLIQKLLKADPSQRLGAGCWEWIPPHQQKSATAKEKTMDGGTQDFSEKKVNNTSHGATKKEVLGKVNQLEQGYAVIRRHPFFAKHKCSLLNNTNSHLKPDYKGKVSQPIPSLQDLSIRATAHFIDHSSLDVDLEDLHPPGDKSLYDALRLKSSDKRQIMHLLDRLHLLKEPRIYRRFFFTKQEARLGRVRPESRDVMGLTQINDRMGQFPGMGDDKPHPEQQMPPSKLTGDSKIKIHHITNPLFYKSINEECTIAGNEAKRKQYIRQLKESIRLVNRLRPSVVVACGYLDDSCLKLLSKVNETVPVIIHDGTAFFNFWVHGAHCIAMPIQSFASKPGDTLWNDATVWFRMELDQIKTARSHSYVFVDGDARDIPGAWIAKIGKSHVLGILGLCNGMNSIDWDKGDHMRDGENLHKKQLFEHTFSIASHGNGRDHNECQEYDDISTSSSDSEKSGPHDEHVLHVVGRLENGVRCIAVQEEDLIWDSEVLL